MKPRLRKVWKESQIESERLGLTGKEQEDYIWNDIIKAKGGDYSILFTRPAELKFVIQKSCDIHDFIEFVEPENNQQEIDELVTEIGKQLDPEPEIVKIEEKTEKEEYVHRKGGRPKKSV